MTSASDRTDDDVIVITEEHLVDPPATGSYGSPNSAEEMERDQNLDSDEEPAGEPPQAADHGLAHEPGTSAAGREPALAGDADVDLAGDAGADLAGDAGVDTEAGADDAPDLDDAADRRAYVGPSVADRSSSGPIAMPGASPVTLPDTSVSPDDAGVGVPADGESAWEHESQEHESQELLAPEQEAHEQEAHGSWAEIQSRFVDDPRAAVEQAAEVTGAALAELVAAAESREQSLRARWRADATGTEELRTALKSYRDLANRLSKLSGEL